MDFPEYEYRRYDYKVLYTLLVVWLVFEGLAEEEIRKLLSHARDLLSGLGEFKATHLDPYPKFPGSYMGRLEFVLTHPNERLVDGVANLLGGKGWTFTDVPGGREAIWSHWKGEQRPLGDYIRWAHIEEVPSAALPENRLNEDSSRRSGSGSDTIR